MCEICTMHKCQMKITIIIMLEKKNINTIYVSHKLINTRQNHCYTKVITTILRTNAFSFDIKGQNKKHLLYTKTYKFLFLCQNTASR